MDKTVYFTPEILEIAKQNMQMSPSTWHKIMNPFCGQCIAERGREVVRKLNKEKENV